MTETALWMPTVFTAPLSPTPVSDGPALRRFVALCIKTEDGKPLVLDPWQAWLIDAALERYPDDWPVRELAGRLRYRSIVISMGRQNGKSELATVLGFYGLLMHDDAPYVIGLASNKEQADLIYRRVKFNVDHHVALGKRFKATGTRGITRLDKSGFYVTKPAKADALQGIPVTLCLFDEVHICSPDMWSAMVLGTTAKADGTVIGITTAGDDNSTLLKDLYEQGYAAAAGTGSERFGFFLWTAPDGCRVDDPDALMAANPALASGRLSMDVVLDAVRAMPEDQARRYRLNQFTSSQSTWLPLSMWNSSIHQGPAPVGQLFFTIDRTPSWEYACITATIKTPDGFYSEVVASIRKPNLEWLLNLCLGLYKHNPTRFVMDGFLGDLAKELDKRGIPTRVLRQQDVQNACATAYALISSGKVTHADDELLRMQMPFAVKTNSGDAWRINRQASTVNIDAVMAMVFGVYVASIEGDAPIGVHFVAQQ